MLVINSRPPGLRYLYAAVAGHALAWYCLYNLFVLWLSHIGYSDAAAQSHFGNLVLAAYLLPLVGGVLAGGFAFYLPWRLACYRSSYTRVESTDNKRFHVSTLKLELFWRHLSLPALGPRRVAVAGATLAVAGYVVAAATATAPTAATLAALAAVVIGCGLVKPNLSAMVGRLFPSGSPYAAAAFAVYYSFINVGSFGSPTLGGWLAERYGYGAAFALAVLGEVVVVAALMLGRQHLAPTASDSSLAAAIGEVNKPDGTVASPELDAMASDHVGHDPTIDAHKRAKLIALWVFFALATFAFWPAYSQNGSGLNLWALHHTDRAVTLFNTAYNVPPSWFAAINSIMCIVATVPLTRYFGRLKLSTSTAVGYGLMAASFATLLLAPVVAAAPGWLVVSIVLSSLSEILISTVGLSQVAKLAPRNQMSTYMAIWFLTVAVGGKLAGMMGSRLPLREGFAVLTCVAVVAGAGVLALRRRLDVGDTAAATTTTAATQPSVNAEAPEQRRKSHCEAMTMSSPATMSEAL